MTERLEPIRIQFEWSLPLLIEIARLNQTTRKDGRRRGSFRWLAIVSTCSGALIGLGLGVLGVEVPCEVIWFLVGAAVTMLAISRVYYPWVLRRWAAREMTSPLRQDVTQVELSAEGVRVMHPLSETRVAWPDVVGLREASLALHVMVSSNHALPIVDAALLGGLSRNDVRTRIAAWREAAA